MTFIDRDGEVHKVRGKVGDNVLYLAHRYDIELEGLCMPNVPDNVVHAHTRTHILVYVSISGFSLYVVVQCFH